MSHTVTTTQLDKTEHTQTHGDSSVTSDSGPDENTNQIDQTVLKALAPTGANTGNSQPTMLSDQESVPEPSDVEGNTTDGNVDTGDESNLTTSQSAPSARYPHQPQYVPPTSLISVLGLLWTDSWHVVDELVDEEVQQLESFYGFSLPRIDKYFYDAITGEVYMGQMRTGLFRPTILHAYLQFRNNPQEKTLKIVSNSLVYFLLGQNIENPQVFVDRSGQYFYVDMCVPPDRRQTLSLIPSTRAARLMLSNAELIYPISAFVARSFESQSPPASDPTKMQNDAATAVTNILERLYSGKVHFSLQTEIARSPIPGDPRYFEEIPRRLRDGLDAKAQLKMRAERRTRLRVSGDIYDWDLAAATLDDVSSMDDDHTILCE